MCLCTLSCTLKAKTKLIHLIGMAKQIKFNLKIDNVQIRNLEQLRDNFCIDDIIKYYREGLLQRWLLVRGYTKELELVNQINSDDDKIVITELIKIFGIETSDSEIRQAIHSMEYDEKMAELRKAILEDTNNIYCQFDTYLETYYDLCCEIMDDPEMPRIKAIVKKLVFEYAPILEIDIRNLFYDIKDFSPVAVMVLLMNDYTRTLLIGNNGVKANNMFEVFDLQTKTWVTCKEFENSYWKEDIEETINKTDGDNEDEDQAADRKVIYDWIYQNILSKNLIEILGENVREINTATQGFFMDVEEKGKRCMILRIHEYSSVSVSAYRDTNPDNVYDDVAINNKYRILDGISYNSNNENNKMWYMEV